MGGVEEQSGESFLYSLPQTQMSLDQSKTSFMTLTW